MCSRSLRADIVLPGFAGKVAVKAEALVTLAHRAHATKVRFGIRNCGFTVVLENHSGSCRGNARAEESADQITIRTPVIGRIEKDYIRMKARARQRTHAGKHVL